MTVEWCRLMTDYYHDPAIVRAGEAAELLFVRLLAYSGAQESRGVVPKSVVPMLTPSSSKARLAALQREGLLVDLGDDLLIRSWERIQESLDRESERRRKDRERKARERAIVHALSQVPSSDCPPDESEDSSTDSPQTVRASKPRIEVEVEVEKTSRRKRPATGAPDVMPITPAMQAWGRQHAPLVTDPARQTLQFLDHHRAKGSAFKDWTAAWRTWMTNAQKYAERDIAKAPVAPIVRQHPVVHRPPGFDQGYLDDAPDGAA